MTGGRLRLILAGSVHPQPEGLRPFLEENGYEVLGELDTLEELLDAARGADPDIVVLGPELAVPDRIQAVRDVAPGVGIVAVTPDPPAKGVLAPTDGYVLRGSPFGALTAELARVAYESTRPTPAPAARKPPRGRPPLAVGRLAPIAAAVAVIAGAWVLFVSFPEGSLPPRADGGGSPGITTTSPPTATIGPAPEDSPLAQAEASLERLVEAIAAGDFERATAEAGTLVRERDAAVEAGLEVGPLEATVATRLATVITPELPAAVDTQLRAILGDLMPPADGEVLVTGDGAFGEVPVGTASGPRLLVISNVGRADVTVVAVGFVGTSGPFSQTSDCVGTTLGGGGTCTVDVTFQPAAVGPSAAQLRIELRGASATVVNLSGSGVLVAPPDTEPPILVCDPVGSGWSGSDVTVGCTARDVGSGLAEPGDAAFVLRTSTPAGVETTSARTDARTVCDREGNCITVGPIGGIKIDKRAPDVTCDRPDGGWHGSNVSVSCTARDRGSGVRAGASFALSTSVARDVETASARTGTRSVCDRVGNCSVAGPVGGIKVDRKAPRVSCEDPGRAWTARNVRVTCRASDGGAGIANADASFALATDVPAGTETANARTGTRSVCDRVGNCSTAGPVAGIRIDRKAPSISIGAPAAGGVYLLDERISTAFDCADGGSGTASCQGSERVDTSSVGNRSFTVTARDAVGNESTQSVGYVVTYGVQLLSDPDEETKKVSIRLVNVDGVNVSSNQIAVTALDLDGASLNRRFAYIPGQQAYRLNIPGNVDEGTHVLRFTAEDDPVIHSVTFTTR